MDVALEEAWALWEDRSRIPEWMAWITSVVVMEDDPKLSKWTLSTYQFNRQVGSYSFVNNKAKPRFKVGYLKTK